MALQQVPGSIRRVRDRESGDDVSSGPSSFNADVEAGLFRIFDVWMNEK
jgi:hypothetical protein